MRRQYAVRTLLPSLVALSAVAVAAAAQNPAPVRERVRVTIGDSPHRSSEYVWSLDPQGAIAFAQRGRLGLVVDLVADAERDSIGARVAGITPGGPADRAGVQTDDIVVRFNGTRLARGGAARGDEEEGQSPPGARLVEMASRLHEGDTVRLDLRRGSRQLSATFEAGESSADLMVRRGPYSVERLREGMVDILPRLRDFVQVTPDVGGHVSIRVGGPLASLELVRVNPALGEYFGTTEGLLVVETPEDSGLGLRAGDVILGIGGRRPTSPAHALRILSTYDAGESVSFDIMRSRRRTTVAGRIPAERQWRVYRNSFEPPLPGLELLPEIGLPFPPGFGKAPLGHAHIRTVRET